MWMLNFKLKHPFNRHTMVSICDVLDMDIGHMFTRLISNVLQNLNIHRYKFHTEQSISLITYQTLHITEGMRERDTILTRDRCSRQCKWISISQYNMHSYSVELMSFSSYLHSCIFGKYIMHLNRINIMLTSYISSPQFDSCYATFCRKPSRLLLTDTTRFTSQIEYKAIMLHTKCSRKQHVW